MANLTKCIICGEEYAYCPNCDNTHAWKFYTDTHEHYQIYMALQQYKMKRDKEESRINFENIGITSDTDLSGFLPEVSAFIGEILTPDEQVGIGFKKTKKNKLTFD